jgi:FkbM family methyltransferase
MLKNKDLLRTILRRLASKRIYKLGAHFLNAARVIQKEGLSTYRSLHRAPAKGEQWRSVQLRGYEHPIFFRPATPDVSALIQNLIREEYGRLPPGLAPQYIVDGGAYIGDVSIYFLNRFPKAQVVSLEPNPVSHAIAQKNLERYRDRVDLVNEGRWSSSSLLGVAGNFTGAKLQQPVGDGPRISCIDVGSLMARFSLSRIDLLKLDIEGAEEEVLLVESDSWLARTESIVVEFHGREIGKRCRERLEQAGFVGYRYRGLNYFFRNK